MAENLSYNPYRDMHDEVQFSAMFFGKNIQNIPLFNSTQTIEAKRLYYSFEYFTFTGKERDSETGFSYFGARYYDSDILTGWLSVDPMADKYPSLSPYAYCAWNPVKLVDPDGEDVWEFNESTGVLSLISNKGGSKEQTVNFMIEKNSKKAMTKSVYYQGQIQDMFDFSFISNKADKIIEGGLKIFGGMTSVVGGVFIGASGAGFLVGGTMFVYGATETVYGIKDIFDGINGNSIESKYEEHETIKVGSKNSFSNKIENLPLLFC